MTGIEPVNKPLCFIPFLFLISRILLKGIQTAYFVRA